MENIHSHTHFVDKTYTTKTLLIRHSQSHFGMYSFVCGVCNEGFYEKGDLEVHIRKHEDGVGVRSAEISGNTSENEEISNIKVEPELNENGATLVEKSVQEQSKSKPDESRIGDLRTESAEFSVGSSDGSVTVNETRFECGKNGDASTTKTSENEVEIIQNVGQIGKSCPSSGNVQIQCGPLFCNICGRTFMHKHTLINHIKVHTGDTPHKCEVCGKLFAKRTNMTVHIRAVHSGERPYICTFCGSSFNCTSALIKHKRLHSGVYPFVCNVCSKGFHQKSQLTAHSRRHKDNPEIKSIEPSSNTSKRKDTATLKIENELNRSEGISVETTVGENPKCELYAKIVDFVRTESPLGHKLNENEGISSETIAGENPKSGYDGKSIDYIPTETTERNTTINGTHSDEACTSSMSSGLKNDDSSKDLSHSVKQFICKLCGKGFIHESNLMKHIKVHTGESPHKCEICGKLFAKKSNMDVHISSVHNGERPFKCKICGDNFTCMASLIRHSRLHSGIYPFVCGVCNKGFHLKRQLTIHAKRHNDGVEIRSNETSGNTLEIKETCSVKIGKELSKKEHTLVYIGKKHSESEFQEKRMDNIHTKSIVRSTGRVTVNGTQTIVGTNIASSGRDPCISENQLLCKLCGKTFMHKISLARHLEVHTGDTPHKCEVCGKCFGKKTNMETHIRAVHEGERPFRCTVCGNHFTSSASLMKHSRLHSGVYPFVCAICNKGFHQKSLMTAHAKRHKDTTQVRCVDPATEPARYCPDSVNISPEHNHEFGFTTLVSEIMNYICKSDQTSFLCEDSSKKNEETALTNSKDSLLQETDDKTSREESSDLRRADNTGRFQNKGESSEVILSRNAPLSTASSIEPQLLRENKLAVVQQEHSISYISDNLSGNVIKHDLQSQNLDTKHDKRRQTYKPFACKICGKSFVQKHYLEKHIKLHTTDPPHKCDICGKAFVTRGDVKRHMMVHTKEKPYECVKCGRGFKFKLLLIKHERSHSGIYPFNCVVCGMGFHRKSDLDIHSKRHTEKITEGAIELPELGAMRDSSNAEISSFNVQVKNEYDDYGISIEKSITESMKSELDEQNIDTLHTGQLDTDVQNDQAHLENSGNGIHNTNTIPRVSSNFQEDEQTVKNTDKSSNGNIQLTDDAAKHMKTNMKLTVSSEQYKTFHEMTFVDSPNFIRDIKVHAGQSCSTCEVCGKGFAKKSNLDVHMRMVHNGERPFSCMLCEKSFASKASLFRHGAIHSGIYPFSCGVCNKGFYLEKDLNLHSRRHIGAGEIKSLDSRGSKAMTNSDNSIETSNFSGSDEEVNENDCVLVEAFKSFRCKICEKAFAHKTNLEKHLKVHTGDTPYKCDVCGKLFSMKSNMTTHMKAVHNGERPFECSECGYTFTSKAGLIRHGRLHSGNYPVVCDVCGKGFHLKNQLDDHSKRHRQDREIFLCSICGRAFSHKTNLERHVTVHNGTTPHVCEICGKGFAKKSNMVAHMTVHSGDRRFTCELCGLGLVSKAALDLHRKVHTGERPYTCNDCGLSFRSKSARNFHAKIHSGVRPYKCDVCDTAFKRRTQLKDHLRIHTGEKPFKCQLCSQEFTRSWTFKQHFAKHTLDGRFKCDVCGLIFEKIESLNKHDKIHRGEKAFHCEFCTKSFYLQKYLNYHKRRCTGQILQKTDLFE